jgi:hypothetical protein
MGALGMLQFLENGRVFKENDANLIWLKNVDMESNKHLKRVLGIDVVNGKEVVSGIKILGRLLNLLGLKLHQVNDIY